MYQPYNLNTEFWEKYMVKVFHFIGNVISTREYILPKKKRKDYLDDNNLKIPKEKLDRAFEIVHHYFTPEVVMRTVRLVISKYLVLTPTLIKMWIKEPEEYIEEIISDAYLFKIETCAEFFYDRLLKFNGDLALSLTDYLLSTIDECNQVSPNQKDFIDKMLLKDACYNALANANSCLASEFNFKNFLANILQREFTVEHELSFVLRRRAAFIIENWASDIEVNDHNLSFRIIVSCLKDNNLVVQIYGAIALKNLIEHLDFKSFTYAEFLRASIEPIVSMVSKMTGSDTTCHLLNIITSIINSLGENVRPFMYDIVNCVSNLWSVSQEKKMILTSIIKILSELVTVLIGGAAELEKQLLPVLLISCDPNNKDALHLLEQGIVLWSTMIEQSGFLSSPILNLFPNILLILQKISDEPKLVKKIAHLILCYLIIGKKEIPKRFWNVLVPAMQIIAVNLHKATHLKDYFFVVHVYIQTTKEEGVNAIKDILKVIWKKMNERLAVSEAYDSGNKLDEVVAAGLVLFSRVSIESPKAFF
eukprot:TRINITY_DN16110_c0_g1_i1.p1 TRINITY_DN16110_c0_g1~~TRINITY_DN16110_c0_g1_i1.p1  ORF type:complete len:534 (-),score=136.70 TRINITY_DN16110_c0_g1_i1:488-2089(-)